MTKRGVDEETGEFLGPSRGEERRAALAVLELAARMVEIPMADNLQGVQEIVDVQKETGLIAMAGHTRRFNPSHQIGRAHV